MTWSQTEYRWTMRMEAGSGKTKAPTLISLPKSSNAIVRAWLKVICSAASHSQTFTAIPRQFFRPVLVGKATHDFVFVHRNGSAPRVSYSAQVRGLQEQILGAGKSATPHRCAVCVCA